jgi:dTDP-4-amino-4,6-dideoxygalactose transaminase
VGTLGDFSFFSLAAGKGLTIYEGGVLVANAAAHTGLVSAKLRQLARPDTALEAQRVLELLGYALFYRPLLFWFVFTLPEIYWTRRGNDINALRENFSIDFPVHAVSNFRKAVGHAAFPRVDNAIGSQRSKAAYYIDGLSNLRDMTIVQEADGDTATYPYLTVLFNRPEQKAKALRAFSGTGLGVSQIYARALPDYGYLRGIVPNSNSENARRLAARAITLSTSPFIKKSHIDKCLKIMHTVC